MREGEGRNKQLEGDIKRHNFVVLINFADFVLICRVYG